MPPRIKLTTLALGVFVAWACTSFYRHVDVSDSSLYRVIARHLAEDRAWTSLRYLPTAYPQFYEHLPFGFWPMAATIRVFGERALPALALLLSVLTVWLTGRAARTAGNGAALLAMLTLGTTQNFFFHATLNVLDVPLLLGASLALVGASRPRVDRAAFLLIAAGTLIGVAAKGPFGLVSPCACVAGKFVIDRAFRPFLLGGAAIVLATLPIALFVATSDDWLAHYGREQLWASASGARSDGVGGPFFAARNLVERFWPGLAFVLLGPLPLLRRRFADPTELPSSAKGLALAAVLAVVVLSLPARKVEHHVFVLFPLFSVLAGTLGGGFVDRLLARRPLVMERLILALIVAGLVAGPLGVARFFCGRPCVGSTEFAATLDTIPEGAAIEIVVDDSPWQMLSSLSAERGLVPVHVSTIEPSGAPWLIVSEPRWNEQLGLRELVRARGWVLAERNARSP